MSETATQVRELQRFAAQRLRGVIQTNRVLESVKVARFRGVSAARLNIGIPIAQTVFDNAIAVDAHVEGNSVVAPLDQILPRPIALLDSSEIIEMSIKPSLWFVPAVAARVVAFSLGIAGMVALAAWTAGGWSTAHQYAFALAVLAGAARLVVASLQWASRTYILTNRRAMRLSGVLEVDVLELPLTRIGQTHTKVSLPQRLAQIGSIRMAPIDQRLPRIAWDHVARPAQIYEKLVRAIRRAQSGE